LGFQGAHRRTGIGFPSDSPHVPMVTILVDTPAASARSFAIVMSSPASTAW